MNDELVRMMLEAVDPARDLTDATLDELVSQDQLMAKITVGLGSEPPVAAGVHLGAWRDVRLRIAAGVAALALAAAAGAALIGPSSPAMPLSAANFGSPHHLQVVSGTGISGTGNHRAATTYGPAAQSGVTLTETRAAAPPARADVVHGRFVKAVTLDGGVLSVTPAPASMKPALSPAQAATIIWATSRIQGYHQQVLGFGLVTLTKHSASVGAIRNVPAYVGFAKSGSAFSCPARSGTPTSAKPPALASNGEAAVVLGRANSVPGTGTYASPPAFVYVAASDPCGSVVRSSLSGASEQVSLPWTQAGPLRGSVLYVKVVPPGCGTLAGYDVRGSVRSVTITMNGLIPEQMLGDYCTATRWVREAVRLAGPGPGSPPALADSTTQIRHAKIGPVRATS